MNYLKKSDGFEGEKLISIPYSVLKNAVEPNSILNQLYVSHIGYFPNATSHYRERKKGCEDNILLYCLSGKGWYIIKNKRFEMQQNEFCIIPATKEYMCYGADEKEPWTIYWVHFTGKNMDTFNQCFNIHLFDGPQQIFYNKKGLEIWHTMYSNLEMGYSTENLSNTSLCLYHFVATFLYPAKHHNEKKQDTKNMINDTILYMRSQISGQLTVEELAKKNNFSTSHFSYLFHKATGTSPLDYFIHLKLQKACLLLYSTDMKIKKIANEIGYGDPFYFSRLFKKYMNISPIQYRFNRKNHFLGKNQFHNRNIE